MLIGIIRERKNPPDTRVVFTPKQCKAIKEKYPSIDFLIESSPDRCYSDQEYIEQELKVTTQLDACDVLLGVKEVPIDHLMPNKTYFFFSHTKKKQAYNQKLMQAFIKKGIRMIDYECLTHTDGQRILGFGFFAGVVGAHNGIRTYGLKHKLFELPHAYEIKNYAALLRFYQDLKLPNIKIAVTGSGKVASGVLEILSHLDVQSIEASDYILKEYNYPVYTQLKGRFLYQEKVSKHYNRELFHKQPEIYESLFSQYIPHTDLLMNGIYWDNKIPRLFEKEAVQNDNFRISVIADITCDTNGSIPINLGASTIADPVYGIDKKSLSQTEAYLNAQETIDIMAVDNLPNELPRDASQYFGAHFEKYVLDALLEGYDNDIIHRATLCAHGKLMPNYEYLADYAYD